MAQSDQARQNGMIISATVLTGLSTLVVLTRLIVRVGIIRKPGWDDLTIFCALLCTIGYLVILFIARENRIGFPVLTLTLDNIISILKGTLAIQVLYYTIVTFVKSSILFMYLRFAASTWFRRAAIWTIVFHAGFWVICVSTTLGQCRPLHKMWDDLKAPVEGTCINTTAFFYFTSGFNIITDIWILAMPIKALSSINRPQKEKIALIAIFGVGLFATITSIIRLHTIYKYTEAIDPIQQALSVNVWSMIEVNVGIICASVPALKPLFTPDKLRSAAHGSSPKYPSSSPFSSKSRSGYVGSKGHDRVEEGLKEDSNNSIPLPRMGTTTTAQAAGMRSYESTERILQR